MVRAAAAPREDLHMPPHVRAATLPDIPRLTELLEADARRRQARSPILWAMADDAPARIGEALTFALAAPEQPFRQFWQVADVGGEIRGIVHSMSLPVPPIYAGAPGEPGLILADSLVAPDAPEGTAEALLGAAEAALREAGARVLLASVTEGGPWGASLGARGYDPLTLYLSRTGLGRAAMPPEIRPAAEPDLPGIVAHSAQNRRVLFEIDPFWAIHPDADARFSAWMARSLTLPDRDMLVMGAEGCVEGYVVAQPASRLHFPPAHDIAAIGVVDDFYHPDLADPAATAGEAPGASALLRGAEAAFAARGVAAAFVVCPAGWRSRIRTLEAAGYETAMTWSVRR